jgi:regulator of protease activity HflC (stomatin/prohibitin superfamily)
LLPGLLLLALALALVVVPPYWSSWAPYIDRLALEVAAPLLMAAGAFLSSYFNARAKSRGPHPLQRTARIGSKSLARPREFIRSLSDQARIRIANVDWAGDWLPPGIMILACGGVLYLGYRAWTVGAAVPSARLDQWLFGILIGLCFPVLVLERRFAALPERNVPDGLAFSLLLRVLLADELILGIAYLLRWLALPYAQLLEGSAIILTGLVAAEILLRNASFVFMPLPPLEMRRGRADSFVAGLLRLQKPSMSAMSASISRQFGIDLSRSWAIQFVRRATLPALGGLVVAGWLMTGVTALDLSQRAVYEAFGRPQAVFHSGLHIHLPWPFGRLRPLEYGAVREIPIVFPAETGVPVEETSATPSATIEGPPPVSAERLWDASHPSEASYLVASNRNGRETFEVVNIDIQILYRIGLSDQAAYNAVYSIDNAESLIRVAAGRMLARYFARYTIPDVLGQNREQFIRGFQQELQGRLNTLSSGIDVLGVVIEAIHPPPGAATAYQGVQAAGIRAETLVAVTRGDAVTLGSAAQSAAITMRNSATAEGTEMVDQAKIDTALFASDVTAYHQDGAAFLFERRLADIGKAIRPETPVTIIDNTITPAQMPMLDLRAAGSPQTPPPSPNDEEQ